MSGIDLFVLVAYFIFILFFGSIFGKGVKTTRDFFFGGQRFSWWLIAFSCVATVVGSYSFIKYSQRAYQFGFSSTQSYLNDWMWIPIWMGAWLPIVYYSRVHSVPEYFHRRFNAPVGKAVTVLLLVYLLGYIGINFVTLGKALDALVPWGIFEWALIVAVVSGIYVTFGGQTSVIMTDLLQGVLLLIAGFFLLIVGVLYMSDYGGFWNAFGGSYRHALTEFNRPADFSAVGIFWQDGIANTAAFYFVNQGLIMRFLAVRSERDGRKAMLFLVIVLMPLAAIAVSGAGWIARAMQTVGIISVPDGDKVFVVVSQILCTKGVFGLVIAALIAALMSTADTLINAVAAIWVNDIWRPYLRPNQPDRHYLTVARWISAIAAVVGIALVPVFMQFKSIFDAHGTFTAAITPPLVVALLMGVLWRRFTSAAAFATLVGGTLLIALSMLFPEIIAPFAHGSEPGGTGAKAYKYMRAAFGVFACFSLGMVVTLFTRPKSREELFGLVIGTRKEAIERYKGKPENTKPGEVLELTFTIADALGEEQIGLASDDLARLSAETGDLLYLSDTRWWLGGLRSAHATAVEDDGPPGQVRVSRPVLETANLAPHTTRVTVEKLL